MVVCIIAFVVLAFLGIFSVRYRELAKEAFGCVTNTITLRPCTTGFDKKLRMKLAVGFSKAHPVLGKIVYQKFQALSFVFMILFLASFGYSVYSVYNLIAFGNCTGTATGFCVIQPESYNDLLFWLNNPANIKPVGINELNLIGSAAAGVSVVEVGCFTCPYTAQTQPIVQEFLTEFKPEIDAGKVNFSFKHFPLPSHAYSFELSEAAECAREQGKYWEMHEQLFLSQGKCSAAGEEHGTNMKAEAILAAGLLGLDLEEFKSCMDNHKFKELVEEQKQEAIAAGIYGTPTFFVNGKAIVAPQSYEELAGKVQEGLGK